MAEPRFDVDRLTGFVSEVYAALGVTADNAALLADSLVQADLWGHRSHGVLRMPWYADRIRSGAIRIDRPPELITDASAIAVIDGRDGIGQQVAKFGMEQAVERARAHGVSAVAMRDSGHFGTALYFTRIAAEAGCIGILTTNGSPAMAPWGGKVKKIGNNPWSIAAPTGLDAPMILDIANTVVARGKLYAARENRLPIPDGWAIDSDGRPTNDAAAGIAGNILPMAGHKGYAITTMMDVLSGVLTGSSFAPNIVGPYNPEGRSGAGHLAMAIDIRQFRPYEDFIHDIQTLIATLKTTPKAPEVDEIYYPGELEVRTDLKNRAAGVPLPEDTVATLDNYARDLGLTPLTAR